MQVICHNYEWFYEELFENYLKISLNKCNLLNSHALRKVKALRENHENYCNKNLRKVTMERSRFRNKVNESSNSIGIGSYKKH